MNTTTTIYTIGHNADAVIEGFLGGMSAGQVAGDLNVNGVADALLDHVQNTNPEAYSTRENDFVDQDGHPSRNVIGFTCQDIAERIVQMARQELELS